MVRKSRTSRISVNIPAAIPNRAAVDNFPYSRYSPFFVKNGGVFPMFNLFGSSNLCDLAEDGDLEGVKRAIAGGADVNERGLFKMAPLMAAAAKGREDVVRYLLSLPETDVDTLNAGGTTALMTAAR